MQQISEVAFLKNKISCKEEILQGSPVVKSRDKLINYLSEKYVHPWSNI